MAKKDFSKAVTNAADKFFSVPSQEEYNDINIREIDNDLNNMNNDDNIIKYANDNIKNQNNNLNDDKEEKIDDDVISNSKKNININAKNKSKHYDERGKREERYGLLLDKQLKDDLKSLANAYGSRSINDFIVTILLEYVESPNNQKILEAFAQIEKLKNI